MPVPCPEKDGSSEQRRVFDGPPPRCIDTEKRYSASIATSKGPMTMELSAAQAPETVNNFVVLARYHYFDGLTFHRIIPGFVAQGGDPQGTGRGGPGYTFADELPQPGRYEIGSVAMANAGPDTNGSQFFIVSGAAGTRLPPQYSLFGKVVAGLDTLAAIDALGSPSGTPREPVVMESVTITELD